MEYLKMYFWPYTIAQLASFILLGAALMSPKVARFLFAFLFGWACYINFSTVIHTPEIYLQYAPMALPWYASFINGWFKDHITTMVSCIAIGQAAIAAGMLLRGIWVKMACAGSIIFLLAIAPLGVGAGFPFSLTVSVAVYFMLKKDRHPDFLWNARKKTSYYGN